MEEESPLFVSGSIYLERYRSDSLLRLIALNYKVISKDRITKSTTKQLTSGLYLAEKMR